MLTNNIIIEQKLIKKLFFQNSLQIPLIRASVAVLGPEQTGKTTLLQLVTNSLNKQVLPTNQLQIYNKKINIPDSDYQVELQLFDVPSDPLYLTYSATMIQNCKLLMIIINAQELEQINQVQKYVQQFKAATKCKQVNGVIIANMSGEAKNEIDIKDLNECGKQNGLAVVQCNKSNNIDVGFNCLAKIFYELQTSEKH